MQISLTLTQQKIKITEPVVTDSWKLATFTDSTTDYAIEKIEGGMTIQFTCNLPCQTCRDDDPDYCLSCNQWVDDYLILYDGKCQIDCPERTFEEAYQCKPCLDKCKTCTKYSGSTCTSCYGGFSDFPFLYGNTCVDSCVEGFYGNRDDAECQTCEDPCETCTETATTCLSCKMPPAGEPITSFFYDFDCIDKCPDGWIAVQPT